MTLKGGTRVVTFLRRIYLITLELFDLAAEHVWRGTFLWCKGRCPSGPILRVPFYFCVHLLTPTTKFDVEGLVFRESAHIQVRAGPLRSPILGFPYMHAYTLCRRITKFDAVTHMGSGLVFRRSITIQPKGGAPALTNFAGFLSMTTL